jgi:hypothetical protein
LSPSPVAGTGEIIVKKELFIFLAMEERILKQEIIDRHGQQQCHSGRTLASSPQD